MRKRNISFKYICRIGTLLFLVYIISGIVIGQGTGENTYINIFLKLTHIYSRNFQGFFYIPIGIVLAYKNLSKKTSGILLFVPITLLFILPMDILSPIWTIGAFEFIKHMNLKKRQVYADLRKMSSVIYYIHMYVWTLYYSVMEHEKTYGLNQFIVVSTCCIIVAILYCKMNLKNRYNIKG